MVDKSFARDVQSNYQIIRSRYRASTGDLEGIEKYSKRTVKVTKQHNEDCKRLLRLMGVPTIDAPCEVEAQSAALFKSDKVFAVASENMDTLTFVVLEELRLTMDQFIDLCIPLDVIIVITLKYDNACVVEYGVSATTVPCRAIREA
ncbi:hypothetical protein ZIOFF_018402 [Zingiber officinale]|uniref:XPG-I domain-containing protein n=1 Tax=Zingiber officinale TaxID=94328 RepID=A0A8J5H813_ZINOF|nr:hypothetical protein ZIOFF_018402 [Zingiber officinale]